ncbi:hypothetical protein DPMN_193417 [Dreissena polymorpha]|uniref:Uncharacterized protein n=1 Tax=Dreissena polymorpha TaxID=45954 RepID=A0A9D3Y5Q8_DREPO|nr:hypothetical protein DPMN_193417 [Dreissena polymorpha]
MLWRSFDPPSRTVLQMTVRTSVDFLFSRCRWMVHGRPQAQMTIYGEKGGTKPNRLAMRMPKQNRL